jgi:hypothetical protein
VAEVSLVRLGVAALAGECSACAVGAWAAGFCVVPITNATAIIANIWRRMRFSLPVDLNTCPRRIGSTPFTYVTCNFFSCVAEVSPSPLRVCSAATGRGAIGRPRQIIGALAISDGSMRRITNNPAAP